MIILTVSNRYKGGSTKTTTAKFILEAASHMGLSGLGVDLDMQMHLMKWAGVRDNPNNIYRLLDNSFELISGIESDDPQLQSKLDALPWSSLEVGKAVVQSVAGFFMIPGSKRMEELEISLASQQLRIWMLAYILRCLDANFDLCVIDCPPQARRTNEAALVAADGVLIPLKMGGLELDGTVQTIKAVELLQKVNPGIKIYGVVPTLVKKRDALTSEVLEAAQGNDLIRPYLTTTQIPYSNVYGRLAKAGQSGYDLGTSEKAGSIINPYVNLTAEMLMRTGEFTRSEIQQMVATAWVGESEEAEYVTA